MRSESGSKPVRMKPNFMWLPLILTVSARSEALGGDWGEMPQICKLQNRLEAEGQME